MSTKQYLIDGINADIAKAGNLKIEDYKKAATEKYAPDKKAEEDFINSTYDKAAVNVQAINDKKVSDTNTEYASKYERNAVQKLINEKQVAEKMANLGLTDSGLNRTQQTAVQLSYGNQKGKIDLAKQSALDNLALDLTSALTEIETNRSGDLLTADQKWKDKADADAQTNYNKDLTAINDRITSAYEQYGKIAEAEIDAAADVQKAAIEAAKAEEKTKSQKIYWFRGKSGENYLYYNTETGKTEEVPPYLNPYNSQDNRIAYSAEYKDKNIGFFQLADGTPGYQPRGLVSEGGKFTKATVDNTVVKYDLYNNGKQNTIWKSKTNKFFIWDDINNRYLDLTKEIKAIYPNIK